MSLGLYLHIPYCFSKCRYCDFYSHPGERGVPEAYVNALLRELSRFAPEAPLQPDTLYFWRRHAQPAAPGAGKTADRCGPADAGGRDHTGSKPGDGDGRKSCRLPGGGCEPHLLRGAVCPGYQLRTLGRPHTAKQARAAFAAAGGQALRTSAATSCWHCRTTPKPSLTKRWN